MKGSLKDRAAFDKTLIEKSYEKAGVFVHSKLDTDDEYDTFAPGDKFKTLQRFWAGTMQRVTKHLARNGTTYCNLHDPDGFSKLVDVGVVYTVLEFNDTDSAKTYRVRNESTGYVSWQLVHPMRMIQKL